MKLSTIAFRNISRNRRRSILSATAIGVAAMSITLLFSWIEGLKADMEHNLTTYYTGEVRVRNTEFDDLEHLRPLHLNVPEAGRLVALLAERPDVAAVAPRTQFPGSVFIGDQDHRAVGVGVDFDREREFGAVTENLVSGRVPGAGRNEALLGAGLAEELRLAAGDTFTVLTTTQYRGSNAMTFEVTGTISLPVADIAATHFYVPLDRAQRLLRMDDAVIDVLIKTAPGVEPNTVAAETRALLSEQGFERVDAHSWLEIETTYGFIRTAQFIYNFVALFFFILGSTVIINTTMMVIYERMREIGTLAAMGMRGGELVRLFFLEALVLAFVGAFAGVAVGIGITSAVSIVGIDIGATMGDVAFEVSNIIYPRVNVRSTVFVFFYCIVVAALASILPSRRAARISPVEALRTV